MKTKKEIEKLQKKLDGLYAKDEAGKVMIKLMIKRLEKEISDYRKSLTLDAIGRKFCINLVVLEADDAYDIGCLNQLLTWVKPKERRGFSLTNWDYIYVCLARKKGEYLSQQIHSIKPSIRTALKKEINKMKDKIEAEYYAYQDAMEEESYPY